MIPYDRKIRMFVNMDLAVTEGREASADAKKLREDQNFEWSEDDRARYENQRTALVKIIEEMDAAFGAIPKP